MPVDDGISLLTFAFEQETDDKIFIRWVNLAQYDISFQEFKESLKPVNVNEKKTLKKLDELMENTQWVKAGVNNGNI